MKNKVKASANVTEIYLHIITFLAVVLRQNGKRSVLKFECFNPLHSLLFLGYSVEVKES